MKPPTPKLQTWRSYLPFLSDFPFLAIVLFSLTVIGRTNYLLFHTLAEMALAGISFTAFAFAWNCRRFEHGFLLVIGISAGFMGLFHILHAAAYDGMNVYMLHKGSNLAPQLWIASRYLQGATLLLAPYFLARPLPIDKAVVGFTLFSAVLLALIMTENFPTCFSDATGLTPFKIYSEYIVSAAVALSAYLCFRKRASFPPATLYYLMAFYFFSILTEILFTVYISMYALPNLAGHLALLLAYYAFYKAIVETGIRRPFDLLFRQLKEAIQARDEFLSIASHELKTPLTPLKMQLQGLRRMMAPEKFSTLSPEQAQRNLDLSTKQIDRLTYLIDNLLDVSRISAGKLELRKEPMDVKSIYMEILSRHEGEIKVAGMKITLSVPEVPLELEVDLLRMDQVITNLFMNAMKYAPRSNVDLGASCEGDTALLWVQDSGPGIPKSAQGKVFERFERSQPQDKVTGLGLGLFISRQIIEAHGGTLRLKSEAGAGARFEIRLPLPAKIP